MPLSLALVLGVVQALTEFLPVSSSGHLVIFQVFLGSALNYAHTDVTFDIFIHFATLLATMIYLRSDIYSLVRFPFSRAEEGCRARKLLILMFIGSIPAATLGIGFGDEIKSLFSSYQVAACGFLVTALLLETAHRMQKPGSPEDGFELPSPLQALFIGCAQALALVPGVSRSGSTIAVGLLGGLPVTSAIRFSFLLSLPAIGGATLLELDKLLEASGQHTTAYLGGFLSAFFVGYFSLLLLVKMVREVKLRYFAIYTLCLGSILLLHASFN